MSRLHLNVIRVDINNRDKMRGKVAPRRDFKGFYHNKFLLDLKKIRH